MLYYLFSYLDKLNFPGAGVFEYITFRSAMAVICSLIISIYFGKKIIRFLQRKQIGEEVRNLGLEGQLQKKGTPTMGGLIILISIIIPTLLFAKLDNIYVILMLITTVWLGTLGFLDDYIKVFKKNKKGLPGKYKIVSQIVLGTIIGFVLYFSDDVVIRTKVENPEQHSIVEIIDNGTENNSTYYVDIKSTKTTIPFFKDNEFDYAKIIWFLGDKAAKYSWIVFVIITIFIVTAVSNGANLTDGLDGLATGTTAIIGVTLGVFAYVSGNHITANYLQIMYIPNTSELVIFMAAFVGAAIGFLWYNAYPAQVFMGDTGSLSIGGIIAVFAIIIKKELLIPIICGIFLAESLSVLIQVSYFKYTKKKSGIGKRIFLMSPLHHHFQKKGMVENKIVVRFWIVSIMLAVLSIITLKLR
jgi:phospho-N-acetylmuramoyl-pentapeptide-transferase